MNLADMVKKVYWKNRKTYQITMEFVYGNGHKIKILFELLFSLFFVAALNKETRKEIRMVKENGCIYKLPNAETVFFLPNLDLDEGQFIQNKIFLDGDYFERKELEQIKKYIKIDDGGYRILDIGANIGNHTMFFCNECGVEKVYALEPCKDTFDILKRNIEINHLEQRVELFNVACGAKREKGNIVIMSNEAGRNRVVSDVGGDIDIVAVDDLGLGKIDFVKIDVEGFEYNVIRGMAKLLERCAPIIYIEIFEQNYSKVNRLLKEYGYEVKKEVQDNYIYIK